MSVYLDIDYASNQAKQVFIDLHRSMGAILRESIVARPSLSNARAHLSKQLLPLVMLSTQAATTGAKAVIDEISRKVLAQFGEPQGQSTILKSLRTQTIEEITQAIEDHIAADTETIYRAFKRASLLEHVKIQSGMDKALASVLTVRELGNLSFKIADRSGKAMFTEHRARASVRQILVNYYVALCALCMSAKKSYVIELYFGPGDARNGRKLSVSSGISPYLESLESLDQAWNTVFHPYSHAEIREPA